MGNRQPKISYEASNAETRQEMRDIIRSTCLDNWRQLFNYPVLGDYTRYISNTLPLRGVNYRLTDMNHPELRDFYWTLTNEFVEEQNRRTDISTYIDIQVFKWWECEDDIVLQIRFHVNAFKPYGSLTPFVAKLVAKDALAQTGGVCPITYDSYSGLDTLYIGRCGHVFSEAVSSQAQCPLCRSDTTWAVVLTKEVM